MKESTKTETFHTLGVDANIPAHIHQFRERIWEKMDKEKRIRIAEKGNAVTKEQIEDFFKSGFDVIYIAEFDKEFTSIQELPWQ